jgi:hypothetical protein
MARSHSFNLPEQRRGRVRGYLQTRLYDPLDLKAETTQTQWNGKGLHLLYLHQFFDALGKRAFWDGDRNTHRCFDLRRRRTRNSRTSGGGLIIREALYTYERIISAAANLK